MFHQPANLKPAAVVELLPAPLLVVLQLRPLSVHIDGIIIMVTIIIIPMLMLVSVIVGRDVVFGGGIATITVGVNDIAIAIANAGVHSIAIDPLHKFASLGVSR